MGRGKPGVMKTSTRFHRLKRTTVRERARLLAAFDRRGLSALRKHRGLRRTLCGEPPCLSHRGSFPARREEAPTSQVLNNRPDAAQGFPANPSRKDARPLQQTKMSAATTHAP